MSIEEQYGIKEDNRHFGTKILIGLCRFVLVIGLVGGGVALFSGQTQSVLYGGAMIASCLMGHVILSLGHIVIQMAESAERQEEMQREQFNAWKERAGKP